jgi:VWFA-related protein
VTARTILAACLVAGAAGLAAQDFRSSVDLVTVPIVVTGRGGASVTREITAADFRVFEDGVEQTVTLLDRQRLPTSVCILLDSSMSMRGWKQRLATAALDHLFRRLRPEDEVAVVSVAASIRLALPWTPATRIPGLDWDRWRVGGTTPLLDALQLALHVMNQAVNPRSVVLIVSDGLDNSSRISLSQLATTRRQSETLVYAVRTVELAIPVTPSGRPVTSESSLSAAFAQDVLDSLVGDSGGVVYDVAIPQRAEASAKAFFDDLESQYVLGYVPKKPADGTYRRLLVEPVDTEWHVRHRGGYLSQPQPPRSK